MFSIDDSHNQQNMNTLNLSISFIRRLARMMMKKNYNYTLVYTFLCYAFLRLKRLLEMSIDWQTLSDVTFKTMTENLTNEHNDYFDSYSCLLTNMKFCKASKTNWFYVCSKLSLKKYKVCIIPCNNADNNVIFISETMKHNLENLLACSLDTCFLLPIQNNVPTFATEARISLISNPHETVNHLTNTLLENYFSEPRFLRVNDIFGINAKELAPDQLYSLSNSSALVYFKVNTINDRSSLGNTGSYVLRGETTLIQEATIHSYLPRKYSLYNSTKEELLDKYPPSFNESLEYLERCILPFIKYDVQLPVKPVFLVKGSQGTGKRRLIQVAAERMGLNYLNTDFAEVQALTSAQTEAKLRIVLHNAQQSVPCILCLSNIEVFGKNSEGQKDERILSSFSSAINTLYEKHFKYPVIIVATTNESDLPAEVNRIFIESIHMDHLDQSKRESLILWLLAKRGLNAQVDLTKLAGMCSDFRFSDLTTLIHHAVRAHCKGTIENPKSLTLIQEDFDKAYEYMQSIYTDCKGAPRVPKVYWEDIGGLADLKHEIMRRIQLPLLNAFGFGQSGLLLYGPPGTGKTLLAKAVATEYQLHFLSIKGPEVLNMYVGQSEKNVRQIFERARAAAPCIIFFDELDSLAPNRGRSGDSGGVMDRVVSQLLAEMDGLESSSSIFIIGATNRPDLVDPALLRPGRFDKMLYVGIHSDRTSQLSVLKALTRKFNLRESGQLETLVDQLPNRTTGADLYAVCSDAWLNAARKVLSKHYNDEDSQTNRDSVENELNDPIVVELEDFLEASRNLVPSVSEEEAERYKKMHMELSSIS